MRRIAIAASFGLAFLLVVAPATEAARSKVLRSWCGKTFTVPMDHRAAGAIYAGTKDVSLHELRVLGYIEMCQRKVRNIHVVRAFNAAAAKAWDLRRNPPAPPWSYSVASWYQDAGGTACGFHAALGVAHKTLPCGTVVDFIYHGRRATGVVQDRGPFISGREWDLNQGLAGALGFDGVDTVGYHIH